MGKLLTLISILVSLALEANAPANYFFTSNGTASFTSDAPLELIKASSSQLRGLIDDEKKTFSFKVAYESFEGFNSGLQREHFNEKYMESERFSEASFSGRLPDNAELLTEGNHIINVKGVLNIHGVEKERVLRCTLTVTNDMLHFESKFTVALADHNIRIPKVVTQKIATEIYVEVKGDLKRKILKE